MEIKENETQFDIVIQKMYNLWIVKADDTIWISPGASFVVATLITAFLCGYFELQSSIPFVMVISPVFGFPIIWFQRLIKYVYIKNNPSLIDFNKNLSDIQTTRNLVAEEYERLIGLFEVDIMTPGIDNESIVAIKKSIDNIVIIMNKYRVSLSGIIDYRFFGYDQLFNEPEIFNHLQNKLSNITKVEMNLLQQRLTAKIQIWISHHATELAELEKQIQSQEIATESENGKAALELSRISLQEHLKKLEKVRM